MLDTRLRDYYSNGGHLAAQVSIDAMPPLHSELKPDICSVLKEYHSHPEHSIWTYLGTFYGFLIGGFGDGSCICDGQIVITRAGSGLEEQKINGKKTYVQTKPHRYRDARTKAILKAIENQDVFLQLASRDCTYLPTIPQDLKKHFYVLGHYRPVFLWAEKRNGHVTFKLKSQAVDLSKIPWYAHPSSHPPAIEDKKVHNLVRTERRTCLQCGIESPKVYRSGWVCLNLRDREDLNGCTSAEIGQAQMSDAEKDDLDPAFLAERESFTGLSKAEFVVPACAETLRGMLPAELAKLKLQDLPEGTPCLSCNTAIMRVSPRGYYCICQNYSIDLPIPIVPLLETTARRPIHPTNRTAVIKVLSTQVQVDVKDSYTAFGYLLTPVVFTLHGIEYKPILFGLPTPEHGVSPEGPDQLYKLTVEAANKGTLNVDRRPMRPNKARIVGTHTSYGTFQAGQQYNYSAIHPVEQEENVPDFVNDAWDTLKALASNVLGAESKDLDMIMFNMYMPGKGIRPHKDNGVTGYVVSVSLGADGSFKFLLGKETILKFEMPHGAIVFMPGDEFQDVFKHSADTVGNKFGPRVNVSLRAVVK